MMSPLFKKLLLLFVMGGGLLSFGEDVKASLTMPDLSPGTNGSFSLSPLTSGSSGSCNGTVTENLSGVTSIVPDNCSGRYEGKAGVVRHGFRFSSFHLFRSILNQNQMVVVNSSPSCPATAVTYNYLMVRTRGYNDYVGPFDASSSSAWAGGVIQYDSLAVVPASGVSRFSLETMALDTTAYGMEGFKGESCSNGEWKTDARSYSNANRPLDSFNTWMFGNNLAVVRSVGGNPVVAVAVPQASLSPATMAEKSANVFSGLLSAYNGRGQQTQKVIYLVPNSTGSLFDLHEASSLTNTASKTSLGTLDCSQLNSPAPGFCSGTLTMNSASGSGKVACLFSYGNQGKDLMFCSAQAPNVNSSLHKKSALTIVAGTSSRSLLAITAPSGLHLGAGTTSGTLDVTVTNLTSRAVPSLNLTNTLTAPFSEPASLSGNTASGTFQSLGSCGTSLPAFSSCTIPITYSPLAQQANGALFRLSYDNGVSNPNATANLIGSRGLVAISVSSNPTYTVGGQGTVSTVATYANGSVQDISSLATLSNSNASVIQVATNGQLTAAAAGTSNLQSSFSTFTSPVRTIISYQADIVLKLDAAQYNGTTFPATGCNTTTWTNLATTSVTSTLTGFSSCSSTGWRGNGTSVSPYGLELDGYSQYVDMGNPASFPTGNNAKTLCAWAQTNNVGLSFSGTILSYGTASTRQSIQIGASNGYVVGGSYNDTNLTSKISVSAGDWLSGKWKHVCLTHGNHVAALYSNGKLVDSRVLNTSQWSAWNIVAGVAFVGRNVDGASYWKGRIAQTSVYNRILSDAEIMSLCKAGSSNYGVSCNPVTVPSYSVVTSSSVTLEPAGGVAPYSFSVISGQGSVNATTGVFTATANAGNAQVQVVDAVSQSAIANIAVGARTNATYYDTVMTDLPLGYWRFDETSGTTATDSSGNGKHGSYNSVVLAQNGSLYGESNRAAYFDGVNSYVNIAGINISDFQNGFSWEAWIKPSSLSANAGSIFNSSTSSSVGILKQTGQGLLEFRTSPFTSTSTLSGHSTSPLTYHNSYATYNLGDGQWHHLVAVWDKTNQKKYIYLDGNVVALATVTTSLNSNLASFGNLTIGAASYRWYGYIDEAAVYGYPLTTNQIRTHYKNRWISGPAVLSKITISPDNTSIFQGDPQNFFATGTYSDNTTRDISSLVAWSSSNTSVATFGENSNTLTAIVNGTTTVSASLNGLSATASVTVTAPVFVRAKGFDSYVYSSLVTPEGVYAAGAFDIYSSTPLKKIVRFLPDQNIIDTTFKLPGTFGAAGAGFNNNIYKIARDPSTAKIYAGGAFSSLNGVTYGRLIRLNTDGTADTAFAVGSGFNNSVWSIAVASDGKVYVGGDFTTYQGTTSNRIIRLNTNGTIDATFNVGTGASGQVRDMAIDSQGRLVIVGNFATYNGTTVNKITRLNTDGSIDATFVSTGMNASYGSQLNYLLVDAQDRIYAIGESTSSYNGGASGTTLFRANADGSLDTTYTTRLRWVSYSYPGPSALALDSSGRLYVGNRSVGYNQGAIVRYNSDGTRDTSYDNGTGVSQPGPWTLSLDSQNRLYVGGFFTALGGVGVSMFGRLLSDGSTDTSFMDIGSGFGTGVSALHQDKAGKLTVHFGEGWFGAGYNGVPGLTLLARINRDGTFDESILNKIGIFYSQSGFTPYLSLSSDSQGRIYHAATWCDWCSVPSSNWPTQVVVWRWFQDGTYDYSWNPTLPATGHHRQNAFKIDTDGYVYLGGDFTTVNGQSWNEIIRYDSDGNIDTSFQIGTGFSGGSVDVITKDEVNQKVYVGGNFTSYNGTSINKLVRLNINGSLDTAFDIGSGFNNQITDIAIQSDGKVLVSGYFTTYRGSTQNRIVRLNSDGTKDTSFDVGTGFNNAPKYLVINAQGKVYAAGLFTTFNGQTRNRVLRLNTDGSLDTGFDTTGGGLNGTVNGIALDPSGDLILGGAFTQYKNVFVDRMVRLTPTGDRR